MTLMTQAPAEQRTEAEVREAALSVAGMDCASCVAHVERAARRVPGVQACQVNLARGRAVVRFDAAATDAGHIASAITDAGYVTVPEEAQDPARTEEARLARHAGEASAWLRRAVVGVALWLPLELAHWALSAAGAMAHAHHRRTGWTGPGWRRRRWLWCWSAAGFTAGRGRPSAAARRTWTR
jgi:cation transport ATPase